MTETRFTKARAEHAVEYAHEGLTIRVVAGLLRIPEEVLRGWLTRPEASGLMKQFQLDWEAAQAEFLRESHRKIVKSADAGGGREWRGLANTLEKYLAERDATHAQSSAPTRPEIEALAQDNPELFERYSMALETWADTWEWVIGYRGSRQ